ncbi:MAG: flavodoxin [Planctomycetota bacterium]|jgi:flavodoxin I|nr:flavodoxin [Planctomycetota bacterium]
MQDIGIFFASCTNRTAGVADDLATRLGIDAEHVHDVYDCSAADLARYRVIVAGSPTWDRAAVPRDWQRVLAALGDCDLSESSVALFGLGDAVGYPKSFCDAMGLLHDGLCARGARLVGTRPHDEFAVEASLAMRDGRCCGLALDCDNQEAELDQRLDAWIAQLQVELPGLLGGGNKG